MADRPHERRLTQPLPERSESIRQVETYPAIVHPCRFLQARTSLSLWERATNISLSLWERARVRVPSFLNSPNAGAIISAPSEYSAMPECLALFGPSLLGRLFHRHIASRHRSGHAPRFAAIKAANSLISQHSLPKPLTRKNCPIYLICVLGFVCFGGRYIRPKGLVFTCFLEKVKCCEGI